MRRIPLMRPDVGKAELRSVAKVLESGYLTEGPVTKMFEESVASYVGASHAVAFSSCTTALEAALRALCVGKGDEVIVPDYTFPATAQVVCLLGAKPVLVDCELDSCNMDPAKLEAAIGERTKCVIPVSLFGLPLNPKIYRIAKERGLPVVEDAAGALGVTLDGKKVGSLADVTCFSFHPRKPVTCGEGGMLVTGDAEIARRASLFKHFGQEASGDGYSSTFATIGTNYKLSDILSAVGVAQMGRIDGMIGRRIRLAKRYGRLLRGKAWCIPPACPKGVRHTYQTYAVRLLGDLEASDVIPMMRALGVEAQLGTYALHLQPCFRDVCLEGGLENSAHLFRKTVALPLHSGMSAADQASVVDALAEAAEDEA